MTEVCSAASNPGAPPCTSAVVQPHRVGRKAHQAEQPPAVGVGEEHDERDRHEQPAAKTVRPSRPSRSHRPKARKAKRHRQREIHEAEQERDSRR